MMKKWLSRAHFSY